MNRWRWLAGVLAIGVVAAMTGVASAERVPMTRSEGQKSSGSRPDVSVPYLTTGVSAFGAYSVAPRIYSSPIVDDPANPQARPVYNLIFYGARQGFGDRSNGAVPRTK
ncbi:MAG TPA: hypothetical protein VKA46_30790 [Gemmataceae bacterium]|nr:hypothetical protein [Gemmataceae bacterium]